MLVTLCAEEPSDGKSDVFEMNLTILQHAPFNGKVFKNYCIALAKAIAECRKNGEGLRHRTKVFVEAGDLLNALSSQTKQLEGVVQPMQAELAGVSTMMHQILYGQKQQQFLEAQHRQSQVHFQQSVLALMLQGPMGRGAMGGGPMGYGGMGASGSMGGGAMGEGATGAAMGNGGIGYGAMGGGGAMGSGPMGAVMGNGGMGGGAMGDAARGCETMSGAITESVKEVGTLAEAQKYSFDRKINT